MRKWALVSVFDKTGILPFCKQLVASGYGILSTGGTAVHLREASLPVTEVSDYTGFPEMMHGRVKTLHPKIHGGILSLRHDQGHMQSMIDHEIDSIEFVIVNLYPFEATIAKPDTTLAQAIEMIDIGGPSMLRSAAKNHPYCLPVVSPDDYPWLTAALAEGREISIEDRRRLATKVFSTTAHYDNAIAAYVTKTLDSGNVGSADAVEHQDVSGGRVWPNTFDTHFVAKQSLRYGENPHQSAHFYADVNPSPASIAGAKQMQGKELSYNNIQDADAALQILRGLDHLNTAVCVAVKHMNPCGVGLGSSAPEAYARAYEADPVSIFGGIVAFNRTVDDALARQLSELFLEIILAPAYTADALAVFAKKKNLRVLTVDVTAPLWKPSDVLFRRVSGGLLVQDVDTAPEPDYTVVTAREPSAEEWQALKLGWSIVKFVKSNAIVLNTATQTTGIGAGQMNRVGAAKIAIEQAGLKAAQSVLASDAFFPMRDTVDTAAAAGIKAIIQPGGSIKDKDSIEAANEHGIAMVFTGRRHFLH